VGYYSNFDLFNGGIPIRALTAHDKQQAKQHDEQVVPLFYHISENICPNT